MDIKSVLKILILSHLKTHQNFIQTLILWKTLRDNNYCSEDFKLVVSGKFFAACLDSFSGLVDNAAYVLLIFSVKRYVRAS
jgi:hypothetical protein